MTPASPRTQRSSLHSPLGRSHTASQRLSMTHIAVHRQRSVKWVSSCSRWIYSSEQAGNAGQSCHEKP